MFHKINKEEVDNLDQGFAQEVDMHETVVYSDKDNSFFSPESGEVLLYTLGVGPCIAFLASGRYYPDADNKKGHYFAALWHYSGGDQSLIKEENLLELGRNNLESFFTDIALELDEATTILHQICLIGGQKKDGNSCGTEKEVHALETALRQADPFKTILPDNMTIDSALKPECHFFPSHGEDFVDVYVQREGDTSMKISYELRDNNLFTTDENRVDPVQPISPRKNFFSNSQSVHYDTLGKSPVEMHFFSSPTDSPNKKRKSVSSISHSYLENSHPEKRRTLLEPQRPGH
jgi:hypothetical protein